MNFLLRNFLRGLAVVVPITLTIYILWLAISGIDRLLGAPWPGAGLAVTLVGITLIGILTSNVAGRAVVRGLDLLFTRAPFVKIVYSSLRDLTDAFVGEKRKFNRPVLVRISDSISVPGFVTRETLVSIGLSDHVAIYFPQSYNFAGNVFLAPASAVTPLDVDSSQVMAFVVSGGVSGLTDPESGPKT